MSKLFACDYELQEKHFSDKRRKTRKRKFSRKQQKKNEHSTWSRELKHSNSVNIINPITARLRFSPTERYDNKHVRRE